MKADSACAVVLCAFLAGCGALPRPFQAEVVPPILLDLGDRAGVHVPPVSGDTPGARQAAAEAMAQALRDLEIPASANSRNRASHSLVGHAALDRLGNLERLHLIWELRDPDGAVTLVQRSDRALPAGLWDRGEPALLHDLAAEVAPKIAGILQKPVPAAAPLPDFPETRVAVLPIKTAPGDGASSLPDALRAALKAAGLQVTAQPSGRDLLIEGAIRIASAGDAWEQVTITWRVLRGSDRRELGRVDQGNLIPAGSLDGLWGPTALDIAQAALAGIRTVIEQTQIASGPQMPADMAK